jgi:uncharacterized membrane protein YedE/YeeE
MKVGFHMKFWFVRTYSTYILSGLPGAPDLPTTGNSSLDNTMSKLLLFAFIFGVASALIGLITLGVMFMWPSKREKAKEHWPYIVVGMLILFSAGSIVAFISGLQLL